MAPKYTDEELLEGLRVLAGEVDGSPTEAQMDERGPASAATYKRRFGSWNEALRAAGLAVNRERDISVDDLLEEIRRLADDLGRVPMAVDVREEGRYSLDPYVDRFDSWSAALVAAGFDVRRAGAGSPDNPSFLRARGPTPVDALPDGRPDTADKLQGVATFAVGRGYTPVAYLPDVHEEAAVVDAFLAANPALLDEHAYNNLVQLFGGQGRRWRDAARPVVEDRLARGDDG